MILAVGATAALAFAVGLVSRDRAPVDRQQVLMTGDLIYRSCAAARADGAAPLRRGQPGYGAHLDGDRDGIACE